MTGVVAEDGTKRARCVIIALQIEQGAATVHLGRKMIRRHPQCLVIAGQCLPSPTQTAIEIAQIGDHMGLGTEINTAQKGLLRGEGVIQSLMGQRRQLPDIGAGRMSTRQRLQGGQGFDILALLQELAGPLQVLAQAHSK